MDRRAKIIALNDQLRTTFRGGRVQMTRNFYDLDDRLRGRAVSVLARYHEFHADSEHDWGTFMFAGYRRGTKPRTAPTRGSDKLRPVATSRDTIR
jgi:hypothetical protein